jgi:hypothetical protein
MGHKAQLSCPPSKLRRTWKKTWPRSSHLRLLLRESRVRLSQNFPLAAGARLSWLSLIWGYIIYITGTRPASAVAVQLPGTIRKNWHNFLKKVPTFLEHTHILRVDMTYCTCHCLQQSFYTGIASSMPRYNWSKLELWNVMHALPRYWLKTPTRQARPVRGISSFHWQISALKCSTSSHWHCVMQIDRTQIINNLYQAHHIFALLSLKASVMP